MLYGPYGPFLRRLTATWRIAQNRFLEYNVKIDIPNAKRILELWPSEVVISGFEIGISLRYPARSILEDFKDVEKHPIPTAYQLYNPTPHERPTWDLTPAG